MSKTEENLKARSLTEEKNPQLSEGRTPGFRDSHLLIHAKSSHGNTGFNVLKANKIELKSFKMKVNYFQINKS